MIPKSFEKNLVSLLLAAMVVFMLAEAVCRRLCPGAHLWPLKGAAGCLAWMASLGIARAADLGLHVKVTALLPLLPAAAGKRLDIFADAAFLVFCLASAIFGCLVFAHSLMRSGAPGHPLVYAAIPVGSFLAAYRLWRRLSTPGDGKPRL